MSEEILIALKEIHARYCIPASEKNYTDKDYACMQYEKLVIHLQQKVERLNNIINELENTIANFIENHTESYIDWKYDREIYLAESNVLQNLFDNYLDKLKELKENNKNE